MNLKLLVILLTFGRIASIVFNILVLKRQLKLRKKKTHPRLMKYRQVLMTLAFIIFLGNIYPLFLDLATLAGVFTQRGPETVNWSLSIYSLDNNLTFLVASILIWVLYKLADTVIEIAELIGVSREKTDN